ncbi:uncharacterized protein LOC131656795 isoform X3 [Vicia villosa]|uniref:uncharacterized protein LOC131656795 isoform X3 n=1 Tax=Vicia villosa TaxID=3911 RepID=UPI00273BB2E0|nr:uncharacterized protein LOC131656795 isoform X3 [Vicia villosa]
MIHLIRKWKSFDKFSPERSIKSPFPTVSASEQDQPLSSLSSVESVQDPSVQPAKAASLLIYAANTPKEFCKWIDLKKKKKINRHMIMNIQAFWIHLMETMLSSPEGKVRRSKLH